MSDRPLDNQDPQPMTSPSDAVDPSRRKLTGAALGVSAILTLASRPVLATVCNSPSAAVSGNLSQHGAPAVCRGKSPGYWKEHPGSWPSPYVPGTYTGQKNQVANWSGGTLFHPLFSGSQFKADIDGNPVTPKTSLSMMQVMIMSDGNNPWGLTDPDNLGMHIVAALLNAKAGLVSVLSETLVINMWNEWASQGYFEPTAGVQWSSAQIVAYIQTTFH